MNEIVLGLACVSILVFHAYESREWRAERARLLDRIMARSYTDFVYTTKTEADADTTAVAPEAPDRAWHEQNFKDHPEQYPDGSEVYD